MNFHHNNGGNTNINNDWNIIYLTCVKFTISNGTNDIFNNIISYFIGVNNMNYKNYQYY